MNERQFLKAQGVITPDGEGEVIDAIAEKVTVKHDNGTTDTFAADDLQNSSSAG